MRWGGRTFEQKSSQFYVHGKPANTCAQAQIGRSATTLVPQHIMCFNRVIHNAQAAQSEVLICPPAGAGPPPPQMSILGCRLLSSNCFLLLSSNAPRSQSSAAPHAGICAASHSALRMHREFL